MPIQDILHLQLLGYVAPAPLDLLDEALVLLELDVQVLGGLLQDDAFRASLTLYAGHEGGEPVEGVADGLAALLLCAGGVRVDGTEGSGRRCGGAVGLRGAKAGGLGTYQRRRGCSASRPR